jgi:signal peptidase
MRSVVTLAIGVAILGSLAFIVPGLLGYDRYAITGGSMSGTFERGSLAFEKSVPAADLKIGDVITYRPPVEAGVEGLVTHRIVDIDRRTGPDRIRTKGDANQTSDPWTFQLDEVNQPRVSFTVPYLGDAFLALADRDLRMLVIGIPAGCIAVLSLIELAGAVRSPSRNNPRPADPATAF